eukprot:4527684-Pyramimonas_sp.AAC.1
MHSTPQKTPPNEYTKRCEAGQCGGPGAEGAGARSAQPEGGVQGGPCRRRAAAPTLPCCRGAEYNPNEELLPISNRTRVSVHRVIHLRHVPNSRVPLPA